MPDVTSTLAMHLCAEVLVLILQVDLAALCADVEFTYYEMTPCAAISVSPSDQPKHTWGSTDWAKATAEVQVAISSSVADQLKLETDSDPYGACVTYAFQQGFARDTAMQLSRLQTLQDQVFGIMLPDLVGQGLAAAAPTIERMKQRAFDDMYYDDTKETLNKLDQGIQGCLIDQIYRRVCKPLELPSDFVLEECAEAHTRRHELHHQLNTLQLAQQKIDNIHEAVCTETTLQNLLVSPASSQTSTDSSQAACIKINHVAHTATLTDAGTPCDAAALKQAPRSNTDTLIDDWSSVSSSSSADAVHLDKLADAESDSGLSAQAAQEKKKPLPSKSKGKGKGKAKA